MTGSSIAIVGGGPAGLAMARLLAQRGRTANTVFERDTVVGGKVCSVAHGGAVHELGACYLTSGYTRVKAWMEEAGHRFVRLQRNEMSDGRSIQDYIYGDRVWASRAQVAGYLARYVGFRLREVVGPTDPALAVSFQAWLKARGLEAVVRLAHRSTVVMGYGYLDELPAFYGLRWNTPSLVYTGLLQDLVVVERGWQSFWQELAQAHDVRTGHEVLDLRRERGRCILVVRSGDEEREEVFDHAVVTVPLCDLARWPGASPAERWLGDGVVQGRYASSLCAVEGWFAGDIATRAFRDRLVPGDARDHLMVARRTADKGEARNPGNLYVLYQYVDPRFDPEHTPGATEEGLRARLEEQLRADVQADGATLTEVIAQRVWTYMPRFTAEALRADAPGRLAALQGVDHTWYAGGSTVLESIDHVVDAGAVLALDIDHAIRGGGPWMHRLRRTGARLSRHTW